MPRKRTKTSTAACQKGKETIEESTSDMEMGKDDAHPGKLSQQGKSLYCYSVVPCMQTW